MRSTFSWFAEFCHSQRLSHLAASFIVAWAETSIAKSCNIHITYEIKTECVKINGEHWPTTLPIQRCASVVSPLGLDAISFPIVNLGLISCNRIIDPSAGSPTETLLRLLLPLSNKVNLTFRNPNELPRRVSVRNIHRIAQSVGATGGVYKGQGRNHDELMIHHY